MIKPLYFLFSFHLTAVLSLNAITPTASFLGTQAYERVGYHLHSAGDVDGDGLDDFLIGTFHNEERGYNAGAAYLILGRKNANWGYDNSLNTADARFLGFNQYDAVGYCLGGGGDVNGDGFDDFLIGTPAGDEKDYQNPGHVYIIFGKSNPQWGYNAIASSVANASFDGEGANELAGLSVAILGDMNDDGYDDIICSAPYNDDNETDAGKAYLILGKPGVWSLGVNLSNADASFRGGIRNGLAGYSVDGLGDVNGDHIPDFAIGARGESKVYLFFGRQNVNWGRNVPVGQADVVFYGEQSSSWTGWRVSRAGDVNGDGLDDLLIGAPMHRQSGDHAGKVYLILGRRNGWVGDLAGANASFVGEAAEDQAGWDVQDAGDMDGDGYDDFLIGAWYNDGNGTDAGKMYLIKGKPSGWQRDVSLSSIGDYFAGEHAGDYAGFSVATAGDVNGDGLNDIITSSTYSNQAYHWGGKILLFTSENTLPAITLNPGLINFGSEIESMSFTVTNSGSGVLNWSAEEFPEEPWIIDIVPQNGNLSADESQSITIHVNRTGLNAGSYSGNIRISASGALNSPADCSVEMTVEASVSEVGRFRLFEKELTSSQSHTNPYVDVSLSARFTGPNGVQFDVDGYWQSGTIYKLRMMPDRTGHWTFITTSNEPSLNGISGEFDCISSTHPGILQVNPDYPCTFELSRGGPFFWNGETNWTLMSNAIPYIDGSFQQYIDQRIEQKFNGIHFVLATGGMPIGTENPVNEGGSLWVSQDNDKINPQFFTWVDRRIAYLDSVQMAMGFFITWSQHFAKFSKEEFERFESYLIARYSAYPLLYWVIVGEYDESGAVSDYNYHGNTINSKDPYGHMITIHPGHSDPDNLGTSRIFHDQNWYDFIMQQLPYPQAIASAEDVNSDLLTDRIYQLPVVNLEYGYEETDYNGHTMTDDDIRKYAWAIALAGGFSSYGHDRTIREVDFAYMNAPGAGYLTKLFEYFEDIEWWKMNPENAKVDNGFCLSNPSVDYIIYLPNGGTVNVDFTTDTGVFLAQWYNPRNGQYAMASPATGGQVETYVSPYQDDAVLRFWPSTAPFIVADPPSLSFSAVHGEQNPAEKIILVTNQGAGSLTWTASEQPELSWLSLTPSSGGSGDQVQVSVAIAGLSAGSYSGTIRISDPNAGNSPVDVPVSLIITSDQPLIAVNPSSLVFSAAEKSSNPPAKTVTVTNTGGGVLAWTASEQPDMPWLSLTNGSGSSGEQVQVSMNIDGLIAGSYNGTIRVSDPNAGNSPVDVPVTLMITAQSGGSVLAEFEAEHSSTLPNDGWQVVTNEGQPGVLALITSGSSLVEAYRLDYPFIVPAGVNRVYVFAEIDVNGSGNDDSYWVKMNGTDKCKWSELAGLGNGWKRSWVYNYGEDEQHAFTVKTGINILNLYPRENGAYVNWLVVTTDKALDIAGYEFSSGAPPTENPVISVAPNALTFTAVQGALNPPGQSITVTNTGSGNLNWTVAEQPEMSWLSLTNSSGGSGDQLTVSVNITGLAVGSYSGTIRISDPNAGNSPVDVPVTLTITTNQPLITVNPASLVFSAIEGSSNPPAKTVTVTNTGGGVLAWTASEQPNMPWLSLTNSSGSSGDQLTVMVNITGLAVGSYSGLIRISDPNAANNPVDVPVSLTVTAQPSGSVLAEFEAEQSSTLPNSAWKVTTNEGSMCLLALANSTTSPSESCRLDYAFQAPAGVSTVYVFGEVDANGSSFDDSFWIKLNGGDLCKWSGLDKLGDGWHRAWVYNKGVDAKHGFSVSPGTNVLNLYPRRDGIFINWLVVTTDKNLNIADYAFGGGLPPANPVIVVSPASLSFTGVIGEGNPSAQSVTISNSGNGTLNWTASEQPELSWLLLNNSSGGSGDQLTVSVNSANLVVGSYSGTIRISDPNASNNPVNIPVMLTITAQSSGSVLAEFEAEDSGSLPNYGWKATDNEGANCLLALVNSSIAPEEAYRLDYVFSVPLGVYTVYIFGEFDVNGSVNDDSFWIRMNGNDLCKWSGLFKLGDGWKRAWVFNDRADVQHAFTVSTGTNVLNLYPRRDGACLNWLVITTDPDFNIGAYTGGTSFANNSSSNRSAADEDFGLSQLPAEFNLRQNYPNPFNSCTKMSFDLPVDSDVQLFIYNTVGQVIARLVNQRLTAGYHEITWQAEDTTQLPLVSGIYIGVLKAEGYSRAIKMSFLK